MVWLWGKGEASAYRSRIANWGGNGGGGHSFEEEEVMTADGQGTMNDEGLCNGKEEVEEGVLGDEIREVMSRKWSLYCRVLCGSVCPHPPGLLVVSSCSLK